MKLNLIHCYRSMNYMCKVMEEKYGIPWLEFNFFGPTKIRESLRKLAERFDETIKENVEKVIAKYDPMMQAVIDEYRPRLEGKKVMLYVGGLRPRHTISAYEDLGMIVRRFRLRVRPRRRLRADRAGDAGSHGGLRRRLRVRAGEICPEALKPDLVGSGIKEKYLFQKMGMPFRQMHSWDYSGPYHAYMGFPVFARDIDMAVNSPTWKLVKSTVLMMSGRSTGLPCHAIE